MSSKKGCNDETTHGLAESEYKHIDIRFRSFFENYNDAMFIGKPDGTILAANPAAQKMFRMSEEELKAAGREGITVKDERMERALQERSKKGTTTSELTFRRKDGSTFQGEITSTLFKDPNGSTSATITIRDITDRKKAEETLRESEAKYRGLFESIKEGVSLRRLIYNNWGEVIDAVLIDANPAALEVYGASSIEELRSKSYYDTASPSMAVAALEVVRKMMASGKPVTSEEHSDINNRDYQVTATPLGKNMVITMSVDITERKRDEEEIKRSNAELQQFAYVASHDLQEPLRMVTSYLGLLEKKYGNELSPQAKEFIGFAVDGSMRMKELIDDLLEYSRIDSGPIDLNEVDMNEVATVVEEDLHASIEETGSMIIINHLPTIRADNTQMKQLLANLVSNAIKFHGDSRPKIEISAVTYENEFVFSVEDNGIGIDPKYADKLFKMFSRLHARDEYPGTGIGLAICKKIVDRHGGKIWFESEPGKGTTFYFTVPV